VTQNVAGVGRIRLYTKSLNEGETKYQRKRVELSLGDGEVQFKKKSKRKEKRGREKEKKTSAEYPMSKLKHGAQSDSLTKQSIYINTDTAIVYGKSTRRKDTTATTAFRSSLGFPHTEEECTGPWRRIPLPRPPAPFPQLKRGPASSLIRPAS
jgi:hypothetical protein